jgi:hypothetical protein
MNFLGLIIAVTTFLVIGIFHPIVIKSEYYFGVKCWWAFLISGIAFIVASLFTDNEILSPVLGVVGCSCLWSILEVFEQRQRVKKGWFPMNPKRKHEYQKIDKNETLCPVHHGRSIYTIDDEDATDTRG